MNLHLVRLVGEYWNVLDELQRAMDGQQHRQTAFILYTFQPRELPVAGTLMKISRSGACFKLLKVYVTWLHSDLNANADTDIHKSSYYVLWNLCDKTAFYVVRWWYSHFPIENPHSFLKHWVQQQVEPVERWNKRDRKPQAHWEWHDPQRKAFFKWLLYLFQPSLSRKAMGALRVYLY